MFGNSKDQAVLKTSNGTSSSQVNMVGEGTLFDGTLQTDGDVRVSGQVVGVLRVGGRVIVSEQGHISGETYAAHGDIAGKVEGDLIVTERLVLRSSAHVEGNVTTGRLIVEEGAFFHGECRMGHKGEKTEKVKLPPEIARKDGNGKEPAVHVLEHSSAKSTPRP